MLLLVEDTYALVFWQAEPTARAVLSKMVVHLSPGHCLVPVRQADGLTVEVPLESIETISSAHRPSDGWVQRSALKRTWRP